MFVVRCFGSDRDVDDVYYAKDFNRVMEIFEENGDLTELKNLVLGLDSDEYYVGGLGFSERIKFDKKYLKRCTANFLTINKSDLASPNTISFTHYSFEKDNLKTIAMNKITKLMGNDVEIRDLTVTCED